jgi:anti-anti-sigma regulatory factor
MLHLLPQRFDLDGMTEEEGRNSTPMIARTPDLSEENQQLCQHLAETEMVLHRRDAILEAVGESARLFFETNEPQQHAQAALDLLGRATNVSRAYIFQNYEGAPDVLQMSQVYEWAAPGVEPQIGNPELQNLRYDDVGFGRWAEALGHGDAIYGLVDTFPEGEHVVLAPQGILAIAVIPVFVGAEWWGFIGFDDCTTRRAWAAVEIKALEAAAGMFGAALYNYRATSERIRIQEEIIRAQEATLQELSTPLMPIADGMLVLPLVGALDTRRAQHVLETLLEGVASWQAETVLVDITGVQIVDTQVANALIQATRAVRLLGARVVLTGIQPQIAQTLVYLGIDLSGIATYSTLQTGIAALLPRA